MNFDLSDLFSNVGVVVAIVAAGVALEVLVRAAFARFGPPATNVAAHRIGVEQPRILNRR
jgi:hypothetical protein